MQTENLETLRSLRNQEKAIKAQIDQVIDAATEEAVACLAEQGLDRGEFNEPSNSSAPTSSTSPTTTSTRKSRRSNGARMPARRSKSRTASKPAPRSWPATLRPSNSSTRTNNPTRSN